jgi:hypothetical protein
LNTTLESIEESPLSTKKLSQANYLKEEFTEVKGEVKRKIFNSRDSSGSNISGEGEMIAQLKEKFHITGKKREQVQVLTVHPNTWLIRKIQQDFKASNYTVQASKKLVAERLLQVIIRDRQSLTGNIPCLNDTLILLL